jgi:acylaminoacyl-peptidase
MKFSWRRITAVLLTACSCVLADKSPVRDHDIVAGDYFTLGTVTSCKLSPDGKLVAYTESRWEKSEDKRNSDLWVVDTDTLERTRLTFDPAGDGSPTWSPDGRWIYFSTSRKRDEAKKPPYNGKKQVWRIRPAGGDMFPVTRLKDGISAYELAGDGKSLYYTVSKKHVDDDPWVELRKEFADLEYGHGVEKMSQVWKLDLESWRSEKLIDEERVVGQFAVSPDGSRIAMITTPTGELITNEGWSRVDVYDAASKEVSTLPDALWRKDAPSPYGWILGLGWSSDGRALSFRVDFDGYPGEVFVAHFDKAGHTGTQELTRPDDAYVTGHMEWIPDSHDLCFTADHHARTRVYCVGDINNGTQGGVSVLTPGDVCVNTFNFSGAGDKIAHIMADVTHTPDLFLGSVGQPSAPHKRITNVNPQVDTWKLPRIEVVKWKSPDGTDVEGILEFPPDYKPGTPLPTIVELHGGPTAASRLEFRFWIYGRTLFPARGWLLLSPNYRGSTGYGDRFLTDLIGHKNDRDIADILSGVDHVIAKGLADADRLAVMGWSNGGYLTNCLITHTTRFKAASSGAGVFDTVTQWLAEDTPGHVINFNQGFPWNKTDAMQRGSALYRVDKVTTPTLIHVGENDPRCPPAHSRGMFRALHHYLDVPSELVVYPGAGHGLRTYTHRQAKMEWDIKWFDHFVLDKSSDEPATSDPSVD